MPPVLTRTPRIANLALNDELAANAVRQQLAKDDILTRTIQNQQLPEKPELLQGAKNFVGHVMRDPVGAIQEGMARDKAANAIAKTMGHNRMGLTGEGLYAVREPIKTLTVNTGGFIGSQLGSTLPGQLAGDFAGAYLARRTIDDSHALGSAIQQSIASPEWATQNVLQRGKAISDRAYNNVLADTSKLGADLFDDTIGWGIGNSVANTVPVPLPLRGGIVAMGYGAEVGQGVKRAILGEPAGVVARETMQEIQKKAPQAWNNGWNREQKMYDDINRELQSVDKEKALMLLNSYL